MADLTADVKIRMMRLSELSRITARASELFFSSTRILNGPALMLGDLPVWLACSSRLAYSSLFEYCKFFITGRLKYL